VEYVAQLFGCDSDTVRRGSRDIEELPSDAADQRVRKKGGPKAS
jgi:hypothetical protein